MSGWASLSGYLFIKPGGGGLNILKSKKRFWCVLEESQGKLLYFKSEEDARSKAPMGYVELCGAAITLDMDTPNQFVVIVEGREILLTAENHESMMIWLMALQARRDQFAKASATPSSSHDRNNDDPESPGFDPEDNPDWTFEAIGGSRERSVSELSVFNHLQQHKFHPNHNNHQQQHASFLHRPLEGTRSFGIHSTGSKVSYLGHSPTWRRNQLKKMGETTDEARHPPLKNSALSLLQSGSKQQSVSMEMTEVHHFPSHQPSYSHGHLSTTPTPYNNNNNNNHHNNNNNHNSYTHNHNNNNTGSGGHAPFLNWSSSASNSTDNTNDDVIASSCLDQGTNSHRLVSRSISARDGSSLGQKMSDLVHKGSVSDSDDRLTSLEQELITTKCELARVMNRQTCFQEILKQKDEIIEDLDEKLGSKVAGGEGYDSKKRLTPTTSSKGNQERVRVLQNQNRFLNEEVRRLAKLRQHEHVQIQSQDGHVRSLEADIEVWKLEYISLIQSSIRFTGTDTMDDAELSLYGGDRHKHRIMSLLEDARKINPSLPTYEYLSTGEVHVDTYGFKHQFTDDGLLLHYLCIELSQHFLSQASSFEKHQKQWSLYLRHNAKNVLNDRKELKKLVRGGIPEPFRKLMWKSFVMAKVDDVITDKGVHYYRQLCNDVPDSPVFHLLTPYIFQHAARYRKQISLDLMRTMPSNVKFSTPGSKGIMDLQDVLLAFCIHNPDVGYCQGMNFLVAMALLFMDAQDAFWTLVAVTECFHSPSYFDHNLLGAQADQSVLHDLMEEKMPRLARHLDAIEIEISTVTLNWFLALFFDAVPFQTLLRIWDCFLLEGPKVLFRFSMGILHSHSKEIMRKTDTISVMRHLKACARISYDIDGLVQAAFKTLKPFPRRQDIVSKQTFYLNGLKEKYRWREMQRVAFSERDGLLDGEGEKEFHDGVFECCAITSPGQAWVAYGCLTGTKVCVVDMVDQTMTDTNIQIDSRVICMSSLEDECVFMGTLSSVVYAWNQETRVMAWQQRVHDAVLSLQVFKDTEGDNSPRLFAALADGTVAVFDPVNLTCKNNDLLYLPIGQSPVSCLQLLGNQLWCASGNTVSVIQASTLDPMDQFTVSSNPYDTILSMVPGLPGVWISVRGSSVLELWDQASLSCKMLYDTSSGKAPIPRKDDENNFNPARITSILALDHSVWVGTGEGALYTFDVFTQNGVTSEASSFFTDSLMGVDNDCCHSVKSSSGKDSSDMQRSDSYARIMEVEKRVKDLYLQRLVGQGFLGGGKRKKSKKEAEEGVDDEEMDEDDNDTETEERRCLILEKEEREMRRTKKKGGGGKDEDVRRRGGVDSSSKGKRKTREKLSSTDSVSGKSEKNSRSNNNNNNVSDSKNSKTINSNNGVAKSTESSSSSQKTKMDKYSFVHDSGIDSCVLRTSIDILSDDKEHEIIGHVVGGGGSGKDDGDDGGGKDSLSNSRSGSTSSQYRNARTTSRNSSTSSAHLLDKTIREEVEDGEEELLNENMDGNSSNTVYGNKIVISYDSSAVLSPPYSPKKISAPEAPKVYYLFRPELLDEDGRSSSNNTITNNSDEALHRCQENSNDNSQSHTVSCSQSPPQSQSQTARTGTSPTSTSSSPRDVTKSEDSGISCSTEKSACAEVRSSSSGGDAILTHDETNNLECCVNTKSQFYTDGEDTEIGGGDRAQAINGEREETPSKTSVTSLESARRSNSEESAKTVESDDVFCEEIQSLNVDDETKGGNPDGENGELKGNNSLNVDDDDCGKTKRKKKISISRLSSQLEMDDRVLAKSADSGGHFDAFYRSKQNKIGLERNEENEKGLENDMNVDAESGLNGENMNTLRSPSKSIAIAKSPISNHRKNRHFGISPTSPHTAKSLPLSFNNHFSEVKINQIAEILSNPRSPKLESSKFAVAMNGTNHEDKHSCSSEEEDSFGEYIGTPKRVENGELFNGNTCDIEATCCSIVDNDQGDVNLTTSSPYCERVSEVLTLPPEENEFPTKDTAILDGQLSDHQSESAYSTSSDSFNSDRESNAIESNSPSNSNVKSLTAKFENGVALGGEEKEDVKTISNIEKHKSSSKSSESKSTSANKCGLKSSKRGDVVEPEVPDDDSVFRPSASNNAHPKSFVRTSSQDSSQSWSSRRANQKLSRLSSSGQNEYPAHEMGSSASSSDKLNFRNGGNRKSSSDSSSSQGFDSPKQILTTTSSGKIKLAKRTSGKKQLIARSPQNDKMESCKNKTKDLAEKIDTKYYGDSDEDKRVHEARVKSFKDCYRRLSVTGISQKTQLKSVETTIATTNPMAVNNHNNNNNTLLQNDISKNHNGNSLLTNNNSNTFNNTTTTTTTNNNNHHVQPSYIDSPTGSPINTKTNTNNTTHIPPPLPLTLPITTTTSTSTTPPSSQQPFHLCDSSTLTPTPSPTLPTCHPTTTTSTTNPKPPTRPHQLPLHKTLPHQNSSHQLCRMSSVDSSSYDENNFPPRDTAARWRLDYTNVHVDTDMESLAFSFDGGESVMTENTSNNTESSALRRRRLSGLGVSADSHEQLMNQFLRDTASTFEEHYKHVLDDEKTCFLQTPTLSGSGSVGWSSYDEISTPSQCDGDNSRLPGGREFKSKFPRSTTYSMTSRSTSVASTVEVQFSVDMSLLSKNKISDKAVKWLLRTDMRGKPTVLSLSGAHSDDEAVLVWMREVNETLWTNCPVFAYNPKTKTSTLPSYMRSQISTSSSAKSSPRQRLASLNSN